MGSGDFFGPQLESTLEGIQAMSHILVVDDEVSIGELLCDILRDEGYQVEMLTDPLEARVWPTQHPTDLVFLDVWMPAMDGLSVLRSWATQACLNMPVIMMSGHANLETAIQAGRLGASGFLEKPITLQKLLDTVQKTLPRRITPAPLPTIPFSPSTSSTPLPSTPLPSTTLFSSPSSTPLSSLSSLSSLSPTAELQLPFKEAKEAFEKAYLAFHLRQAQGSISRLADQIGLERTHLYRKLKQLGLGSGSQSVSPS
jgi:DNA-binding NtrC family response regulator